MAESPAVPLTLEGSWVLHQMFRWNHADWRATPEEHRDHVIGEAVQALSPLEARSGGEHPNQSAAYSLLGHKGDLMFLHFRDALEELHKVEQTLARLEISDYLEATHSYVSVVELGLYESSAKTYAQLSERALEPH